MLLSHLGSVFALVLVCLAFWQAERVLWYTEDLRNVADARLKEAIHNPSKSVDEIHKKHRPTAPCNRPWWVRLPGEWWGPVSEECPDAKGMESELPVRPGLGFAVGFGALF